jgi:alkaline phosphatase D
MHTDRRRFLLGTLASLAMPLAGCKSDDTDDTDGAATPAPDRAPEPEAWVPPGQIDRAAFPFPVQVGDVSDHGAIVALRTEEAAATATVLVAGTDGWTEVQPASTAAPSAGRLEHTLDGLLPDTAYTVAFSTADGRWSPPARFRTTLAAGGFRKLVLAATSCFGGSNPGGFENAARVAEDRPDAYLLLGDSVYCDGAVTLEEYRAHWDRWLAQPAIQAIFANASVITCWDDHEVSNDWTLGPGTSLADHVEPDQLTAAIAAFRESMPMGHGDAGSGFWRKISFGTVLDVIVLDSRGERDDADRIVSDEQLAWAIDAIRTSEATFKLVMASVHMTDHTALIGTIQASDRWQGYSAQRSALVAAMAETPGTFVVTGDMHYGATQRVDPEGTPGFDVWEIAAGPVGSTLFPVDGIIAAHTAGKPSQYDVMLEGWTSSRLTLDPGTMTILAEFVDDAGEVVASATLAL